MAVQRFITGKQRQDLDTNEQLAFATVRGLELVGEAAGRVSPEGIAFVSELPWQAIIGMRNRLIHAYFEVDLDQVWATAVDALPPLIEALERVLD